MDDLFADLPSVPSRAPRVVDLLPGWALVQNTNYLQSPCGRVRIFRAQPSEQMTSQRYTVYVRLAGEWAAVRTLAVELEPAALIARRVASELVPADAGED